MAIGINVPNEFKRLSRIFRSLDNETKLSILSLLSEEGAKSVTDISKALKINFSTAHKYLEDLESAGLVRSKQETHNRLKRMFSIQDFSVKLSPREINSDDSWESKAKGFKIVTEKGVIRNFDEIKFIKPYLEQGLPQSIVKGGINFLRRHVYDGITLVELKFLFKDYLLNNIELINKTLGTLEEQDIHTRTFSSILNLLHPKALKMHMKGDIFISNLRYPKLRNCVLDLRGLYLHGFNNKVAKDLPTFLKQTIGLMEASRDDILPTYCLSNFNYYIAPLTSQTSSLNVRNALREFFSELKEKGYNIFLEIDLGDVPKFLGKQPAIYILSVLGQNGVANKKADYATFAGAAKQVADILVEVLAEDSPNNIIPIFKNFNWDGKSPDITQLNNYYLTNMGDGKENASFVGRLNRFDSFWTGWLGTSRVGEMQNITLNLPRLTKGVTSINQFMKNLEELVNAAIEYQLNMAELAVADFTRNHDLSTPSIQRVKWDYVRLVNCLYSLSIVGLNETVMLLSGKTLKENPKLGELILKQCNEIIKKKNSNIRIELKEETNPLIADRFYYLDSLQSQLKVKNYSIGIGCKDWSVSALLQQYLHGGHCTTVRKQEFDLQKALNSNVSLFRVN